MLSRLILRHHKPQPKFAQGLFITLVAVFGVLAVYKPVLGLSGLGTVAIIAAVLIEYNRHRIWDAYRVYYKKNKNIKGALYEPKRLYYVINIIILWPLVGLLGILCLWEAFILS